MSDLEKLQKKIEILSKALDKYADKESWDYCCNDIFTLGLGFQIAQEALQEALDV